MIQPEQKGPNLNVQEPLKKLVHIGDFISIVKYNIDLLLEDTENHFSKVISGYIKSATNGDLKDRENFILFIKTRLLTDITLFELKDGSAFKKPIFHIALENKEYRYLVDSIIPFQDEKKLSYRDKFSILLYHYKDVNKLGYDRAFDKIRKKYPYYKKQNIHDNLSNKWYEYTACDLENMYQQEEISLTFYDKVNIIAQRIYEELYGLGCIDILAYSDINEVGIANDGRYIYAWASDKIHLSFLTLTEQETRIIQDRSISFDDKVGALNHSNPEVLCYRADNARITALQPPYCSARTLCIRIFNKRESNFKEIIRNDKQQLLVQALIRTGQKISLQGGLGAGKTTAMQVMLEVLDDSLHIGTVEDYFEQHNMLKYPNKRVIELQECSSKSLIDAVMSLFRLSVDVANVGEARDGNAVFSFIQLAQAIEKSAMLTSHIASPQDTVPRYKNMLMASKLYSSEQTAIADIVQYFNIIFQHEIIDGVRRITKIVEIIPQNSTNNDLKISLDTDMETLEKLAYIQQIQQNPYYLYRLNPLMEFINGEYCFLNYPSEKIMKRLTNNSALHGILDMLLTAIEQDIGKPYLYRA